MVMSASISIPIGLKSLPYHKVHQSADMTSPVVLYRYDGSPFSTKVDSILLLKDIAHVKVDVSRILPRPELSDFLGVTYRRIPILAIGKDIYCDTSLIASALERRFSPRDGYGTIFPTVKNGQGATDAGVQKAFSMFYCDRALFSLSAASLPWHKVPSSFLEDRSALRGTKLDPHAMLALQPVIQSSLSSHLDFVEEQLSDGREWLFNTVSPAFSDISLHFILSWIQPFPGIEGVLTKQKFPKTLAWLDRFTEFLTQKARGGAGSSHKLDGRSAAKLIASASHEDPHVVGLDEDEASRLGLRAGVTVSVAPDDYGRSHPTQGKLVALNREEIVIETKGSLSLVRVHFPRLGYVVTRAPTARL